jgi:hypothetical protein
MSHEISLIEILKVLNFAFHSHYFFSYLLLPQNSNSPSTEFTENDFLKNLPFPFLPSNVIITESDILFYLFDSKKKRIVDRVYFVFFINL